MSTYEAKGYTERIISGAVKPKDISMDAAMRKILEDHWIFSSEDVFWQALYEGLRCNRIWVTE